jgi:hypothetical protein
MRCQLCTSLGSTDPITVRSKTLFKSAPKLLAIKLTREAVDDEEIGRVYLADNHTTEINKYFNILKKDIDDDTDGYSYDLYAVVYYSRPNHYTAKVYLENEQQWYDFDDDTCRKSKGPNESQCTGNEILVFYIRRDSSVKG